MTSPSQLDDALGGELADRAAIARVVNDWGLFRDTARWAALRSLYAADAVMVTTWYAGPADGFVERSRAAAERGSQVQHFIGPATIEVAGPRAVAECRMMLSLRASVGGVPVDVTCWGRFYDRFLYEQGSWRIKARVPIYEKDRMDPLEPGRAVPIDRAALESFPPAYRHIAAIQALDGATLTPGLATPRSPELQALYAEGARWLRHEAVAQG